MGQGCPGGEFGYGASHMSNSSNRSEFDQWLNLVTRELIEPIRTQTRQELENHYLDACDSYECGGMAVNEAHSLVMASLGDADEIAGALQQIHFSPKRALWVLFACLAYPLSLYVLQSLYRVLSFEWITILASVITSIIIIFVVLSVKKLLQPFDGPLDRPLQLLIFSQIIWALCPMIGFLINGQLPLMNEYGAVYLNMDTFALAVMNVSMLVSELLSGAACFWFGGKLLKKDHKLLYINGIVLTTIGLLTIILCAMILLNNQLVANIISSLNYVLVTIVLSLFAYFFFKIFRYGFHPPAQIAQ
jgi:hypothetical protein